MTTAGYKRGRMTGPFPISRTGATKMFRKALVSACAVLLLASGLSWGQYTSTASIDFNIINPQTDDNRLRVASDPYMMGGNTVGSFVSAWSTSASADSILSYAGGQDRYWDVSIERWYNADSIVVLKVEEKETQSGRLKAVYRDTVSWNRRADAHNEMDVGSTPIGLNLTVCAVTTLEALSPATLATWRWKIYLSQKKLMKASDEGAIATYSRPARMDSLTILANDTIKIASTDTTFTTPITGRYGYITLFVNATTTSVDTAASCIGLGYQIKANGGSWSGPIDYYSKMSFALVDSVAFARGQTRAYWPTTTPADSVRFAVFNKSVLGRLVITSIKALWRD